MLTTPRSVCGTASGAAVFVLHYSGRGIPNVVSKFINDPVQRKRNAMTVPIVSATQRGSQPRSASFTADVRAIIRTAGRPHSRDRSTIPSDSVATYGRQAYTVRRNSRLVAHQPVRSTANQNDYRQRSGLFLTASGHRFGSSRQPWHEVSVL